MITDPEAKTSGGLKLKHLAGGAFGAAASLKKGVGHSLDNSSMVSTDIECQTTRGDEFLLSDLK